MSIIVNTNISSINAQRSLNVIQKSLDKSLQRLASGLRINNAGDDAAGLAIANGLSSQVRGLGQAVRNAGDGLSLIGVAEGAVNQQTEILQRIRELSIQAANDINSGANRSQIQTEITAQISELTRIGNTTTFNGQYLINGTFSNKQIQVGAYSNQIISVSLGDFRANMMGTIAQSTGAGMTLQAAGAIAGGGDVTINGFNVGVPTADGISSHFSSVSAIAKATAINAISGQTNVTATATAASLTGNAAVAAGASTGTLTINGISIVTPATAITTTLNDGSGTLRAAINAKSNSTGVVASWDGGTNRVVLTAADGRNVIVDVVGAATSLGFTAATGSTGTATHQASGNLKLTSNADIVLTTTNVAQIGFASGTIATDPTKRVNTIDVTTNTGAANAIDIVDSALSTIATAQSQLGALTNRLQNTIANLQTSIENMSASESRIRDADFAAETANLTRAQIIQQAGVAVLTQANVRPQAALALLGG